MAMGLLQHLGKSVTAYRFRSGLARVVALNRRPSPQREPRLNAPAGNTSVDEGEGRVQNGRLRVAGRLRANVCAASTNAPMAMDRTLPADGGWALRGVATPSRSAMDAMPSERRMFRSAT